VRNPREETAVLAEEYAHAKLHAGDRDEVTIHISSATSGDPREYEADYVARSLLAGPGVEVAYFIPPRPSRAPSRAKPRRAPMHPAWMLENVYESDVAVYARRMPLRRVRPVDRSDPVRFQHGKTQFRDRDGQWWDIHDVRISFGANGQITRSEVSLGDQLARRRYFIGEKGTRRFYSFARFERRAVTASMLERQLRDSVIIMPREAFKLPNAAG
jgi:hypothetical protein